MDAPCWVPENHLGMPTAIAVLQWITGGAFALLGLITFRRWLRLRSRHHAALAVAIGSLGLLSILGRISPLVGYPRMLSNVSLLAFAASGWGLLQFRHTLVPVSMRMRLFTVGALAGSGALTAAARLPTRPTPPDQIPAAGFAAVVLLIAVWSACVGEPAVRFWLASRGRPRVQRARLRALSAGYLGVVLIFIVAISAAPVGANLGVQLALQLLVVCLLPLMYASLAPPALLRRIWRAPEQAALRHAIEDIARAPDEHMLAKDSLGWALRLLGADAGVIVDPGGPILAWTGVDEEEAAVMARAFSSGETSIRGRLIGCRFASGQGDAVIAVRSGPFTPVFGTDELDMLCDLARSIGSAMERLQLLAAVRQESSRYEMLLQAISDLGVGVAISQGDRVTYANDAMLAINGYSLEELRARSFLELVPDDAREEQRSRLVRFLRGEDDNEFWETALVRKDGGRRDLEGAAKRLMIGGRLHVLSIWRDVTERRRVYRRERKRVEQLAALASISQRLAGSLDLETLPSAIARSATEVAGCRTARVGILQPGERMEWYGPDGLEPPAAEAAPVLDIALNEGRPVRITGIGGRFGERGTARALLAVPMMRRGAVIGVIVLARDADQERFDDLDESIAASLGAFAAEAVETARALERERMMTRRLRELDEVKNSFLAAVSHELRTPLTAVIGFSQTLQRSPDALGAAERAEIIDRLAANAAKLERLLGDLLDLDRLQRGIFEPVRRRTDVTSLVERVVGEFDFEPRRRVVVLAEPLQADIDAPKVERIVENLLSNAVRHTRDDTTIWVRASGSDGGIEIAVEDAGRGVPADLRAAIFEPFHRGPHVAGHAPGVGIGLSLVARFAELHGGRAWVEERDGGGASFRVWLPASHAAAPVTSG